MFRTLAVCCIAATVSSTAVAQTRDHSKPSVQTASAETRAELAAYKQCYEGGSSYSGQSANSPKPMGYGPMWPATGNRDCSRFYHYPYVFYPQNFYGSEYYRSSDSMYYRYPSEMQIPVYNRQWHNEYPSPRRYHSGHHFITDVF
jgi:hypothetical protein